MTELIGQIFSNPLQSLAIVGNLVIIESLLSVDNAAVLATMVLDLPANQRKRALRYGMFGAYLFRGIAMAFAALLVRVWWLKPLGGIYLLYLFYTFLKGKQKKTEKEEIVDKQSNWLYKATVAKIGNFWATIFLVEIMDLAFSIDNVFAAVAFTPNIILVCTGVFIGIFAMRFIAQWFVQLMEHFPFLEYAAFIVIGILGVKLTISVAEHFDPEASLSKFLESRSADIFTSALTVSIFIVPIVTCILFDYPKRATEKRN